MEWTRSDGYMRGIADARNTIHDPLGIESDQSETQALGILDIDTKFIGEKLTTRTEAVVVTNIGLLADARGIKVSGYEIHVGVSASSGGATKAMESLQPSRAVGYLDSTGRVFGSYMHDLFKNEDFTELVIKNLARMKGLDVVAESVPFSQEAEFDKLAAHLRRHIDISRGLSVYGARRPIRVIASIELMSDGSKKVLPRCRTRWYALPLCARHQVQCQHRSTLHPTAHCCR